MWVKPINLIQTWPRVRPSWSNDPSPSLHPLGHNTSQIDRKTNLAILSAKSIIWPTLPQSSPSWFGHDPCQVTRTTDLAGNLVNELLHLLILPTRVSSVQLNRSQTEVWYRMAQPLDFLWPYLLAASEPHWFISDWGTVRTRMELGFSKTRGIKMCKYEGGHAPMKKG